MDKKAIIIWKNLLDAYFFDFSMSEEWRKNVLQLLFNESFEKEKFAALEEIFNSMIEEKK
jgi:hypothetical protein